MNLPRRILLAIVAAVISWLLLKLILVPEDNLIIQLGSDKMLEGAVEYSTVLPGARSAQKVFSPEQVTITGIQPREVVIILEPLGQNNHKGLGSEIWIYEITSELERIGPEAFDSLFLPASWKYDEKQRAIVFLGGEQIPLTLSLKATGKVSLHLLKHPWSGQVRITVDGISRIVDLYDPEGHRIQETFLLPFPLEVTQNIKMSLPRTTLQARLVFTGPRLLRLERAEWQSRSVWDPKHNTIEAGPGVRILESDEKGLLLNIEQSEGWIKFDGLQKKTFFLPDSKGLIAIFILVFFWLIVWETYLPYTKFGLFLQKQTYWAKYSLICLFVWLVYWLAFFPGLMSPDSIYQWGQMLGLEQINDIHPAIHTLMIWLITRIWLSPAMVALVQMIIMSIIIGWGLSRFSRLGVPQYALWIICSLYAFLPAMGMMAISLWKDIPYSISVLWLTLLTLEILISRGDWLKRSRWNIILLMIALVCVSLFRHNGPLVALGTVVTLGIVYRPVVRQILIVFLVATALYVVVRGPLYGIVGVRTLNFTFYQLAAHQVAATIAAGTPLKSEEQIILNKLYPLDKWGKMYTCTTQHSIVWTQDFKHSLLEDNNYIKAFRGVWLSLILRNPLSVIKHQFCAGALVWLVPPLTYLYTVEKEIPPNDLGLSIQSKWPAMRQLITKLHDWSKKPKLIWLLWGPALYFYIVLLLTGIVTYKMREPRWLLFAVPAVLQSVSVLLANVGQDFRYQFSVYLVGLMSLCLIFVSRK